MCFFSFSFSSPSLNGAIMIEIDAEKAFFLSNISHMHSRRPSRKRESMRSHSGP